jgi:tetratricopeptide (TPR) repeat protein
MSAEERQGSARDVLLVAGAAIALYLAAGAAGFGFVNYDDDAVVQGNPVQSWATMGKAFTERMAHAWLPLYALSLGIDNALFGPDRPGAYHVHSVLLHALNAVLVLLLARRLGLARGAALLAGLLFAVLPGVTESVAWVASRKDLLSFSFAAGAALVFLRAEGEPRRPALHAAGALLLGLGMLAKGSVVVVPALLVLAVLARGGARRSLLGTIPYFVVAGGVAAVHLSIASSEGTSAASLGPGDTTGGRVLAALHGFTLYIRTLFPGLPLSVEHGVSPGSVDWTRAATGALFLVAAALFVLGRWRRGDRGIAMAMAGILVALSPFNGVLPRTSVIMAERYVYVAAAIYCGLLGVLAHRAALRWPAAKAAGWGAVWLYALVAFLQLPAWRDSVSLWENGVVRAWTSPLARAKLGEALADAALASRDPKERTSLFERAAAEQRLAAEHARYPLEEMRARHDAGLALLGAGKAEEAAEEFRKARALLGPSGEALTPAFRASLEVNRAKALEACGREEDAIGALEEAVRGDPSSAAAWLNLGVLRMRAGDLEKARLALLRATKEAPDLVAARLALSDLEALGGDFGTALRIAVKAAEDAPRDPAALAKAGQIAALLGQPVKAREWFTKALAVDPGDAGARRGLAGAIAFLARAALGEGKAADGLRLAEEATKVDGGAPEAWFALGDARRVAGDGTGALEAYLRAGKEGGGPRARDARAAVYAAQALAERKKGNGPQARSLLEKALAEDPAEIRVGGRRAPVKEGLDRIPAPPAGAEAREPLIDGVLALAAGETKEAVAAFDRALRVAGEDHAGHGHDGSPAEVRPAALVLRSRARIGADDLDGAVSDLDTLCREAPKDARAAFLLGHTLAARAARRRADGKAAEAAPDSARARAVLEEARTLDPSLAEPSLGLAELHFVEGRAVDAIRELNGVLERDPDRVEAHLVLGNIMKAQFVETRDAGFRAQGEEHFRRALSADPGEARALAGLGELEAFANRPREALGYALRALAADPDLPAARSLAATLFVRNGRAHLEEGDADRALESAKRADELAGETAALCLLRADAVRRKGDWKGAQAEVERARVLAPKDPEVRDAVASHYRDVAYAFLLHRRNDQAREAVRRAEAAGSERVELDEVRRLVDGEPGSGQAAAAPPVDPAVAAALDKAAGEAHRLATEGAALIKEGRNADAAERFRASLRAFETAFGRFGLALALSADGDLAGAEREYRRSADDDPTYADAWLNLGALLFRRGADAEAEEAYARYLLHAPKTGAEETVVRVEGILDALRARRAKDPKDPKDPKDEGGGK